MAAFKVLIIVEGDRGKGLTLAKKLASHHYDVSVAIISNRIRKKIVDEKIDLILADTAWINSAKGLSVIETINSLGHARPSVVMVSGLSEWWSSKQREDNFDILVNWRELLNVIEYFSKLKKSRALKKAA
jgi:DNA-binding NtrC family response regulator